MSRLASKIGTGVLPLASNELHDMVIQHIIEAGRGYDLTICGLEIYTTKQAFSDQLNDPEYFQPYRKAVEDEGLYGEPAEHVAWYPAAGFVARDVNAKPFGHVLISVSRLACNDRDAIVHLLQYGLQLVALSQN